MSDRDYIHPLALAVLDAQSVREIMNSADARALEGEPILTPRAHAVLEAVEEAMSWCDSCELDKGSCRWCSVSMERFDRIRRAWRES